MRRVYSARMIMLLCVAAAAFFISNCSSDTCLPMEMPYIKGILDERLGDTGRWKCICREADKLDATKETVESISARFGSGMSEWESGMQGGDQVFYIKEIVYQFFKENGDAEYLIFRFDKKGKMIDKEKVTCAREGYVPVPH